MFKDHQLAAFSQPITSLPDTPNLPAQTLKERFDACPEELRESYNGLCAALDDISAARQLGFQRSAGVPADTVQSAIESVQLQVADAVMGVIPSGSVTGDKLAADVQARFSAIESAAQTEAAARQQGDAAEVTARQQADAAEAAARQQADNNLQSQINTHTTQIGAKCQIVVGSYEGTTYQPEYGDQYIALGFTPKAVIVFHSTGAIDRGGIAYGGIASPITANATGIRIEGAGFRVYQRYGMGFSLNQQGDSYGYIAMV